MSSTSLWCLKEKLGEDHNAGSEAAQYADSIQLKDEEYRDPISDENCTTPISRKQLTLSEHLFLLQSGKDGRTKFTIENVTKTRIVLADSRFISWEPTKSSSCSSYSLCFDHGNTTNKIYGNLRNLSSRISERL
uniref:Uncharacterized protein n=1 Tax=Ditylenchus dipsaci TaxID=166011 RepID=A0A915DED4_9BILA